MFDIMNGPPPRCPQCKKPMTSETETQSGMLSKMAWDGLYNTFFLFRRPRFICNNPNCPNYYQKTRRKFVRSLAPGVVVAEHMLDEATREKDVKRSGRKTGRAGR